MKKMPIDLRESMRSMTVTVEKKYPVKFKNVWLVLLGIEFIKLGCKLCGMNYEEGEV
jgi:hypothetical protein